MSRSVSYEPKRLPVDEDEESLAESKRPRTKTTLAPRVWALFVFLVVLVLTATLYATSSLRWSRSPDCQAEESANDARKSSGPAVLTCGTTRAEALAKGCVFDVLAVGWVPAACYDEQRANKFENMSTIVAYGTAGSFPWYLDENMTTPIAERDLSDLGDNPVAWTTEEFHQAHCLYTWQSTSNALHKARRDHTGVWALDRNSDTHHIRHCLIVLESMPWRHNKSVEVDFGYRDCVRLDIR